MKKNNKLFIVFVLIVAFVFCGLDFTVKTKISYDRVDLYDGNIESNNPGRGFSVNDNNKIWSETQSLNIFNSDQVFPGDSGTYEFLIRNNTDDESEYSMEFIEENDFNANIKYKLKRNDEYVAGDDDRWVSYSDLNVSLRKLNSKNKDLYKIIWKWVPTDNDTNVGRNRNATYALKLTITATATELYFYTPPAGETEVDVKNEVNVVTGDKIYYYVVIALLSGVVLILVNIIKKQKDKNEKI